ncbi:sugar transferase [Brevundimonas staleyi]|uniref:Sugar transferase n=1 Tax=Brevundimonas staleyi TaxID=74326 RepID=A0ABW0FVA1_9CAUL
MDGVPTTDPSGRRQVVWRSRYKTTDDQVTLVENRLHRTTISGLSFFKDKFRLSLGDLMFDSFSAVRDEVRPASREEVRWRPAFGRSRFCPSLKRTLDVTAAVAVLVIFAWAYALVALAIVMESRGPVLFRQRRTGRYGKVFTIYKFRSMTVTEDGDVIAHATRGDQRVTRVGAFIRATSLDELPQLLNVLRGDMSLVGPRPHALAHDLHYGALLPRYAERFEVRPGLTGLAQVQGHRGEIHQLDCMARRVDADADYAARWSFVDDLVIVARTVPLLLARTNAY